MLHIVLSASPAFDDMHLADALVGLFVGLSRRLELPSSNVHNTSTVTIPLNV